MHTLNILQAIALGSCVVLGACSDDPRYLQPDDEIEAGDPNADPDVPVPPTQITLPIRLETGEEADDRAERAAELGVEVPYIALDDLDVSMEWRIRNLEDTDANVRIQLNGANEYFAYVPSSFVVDPEEEEEPPPLAGNVPLSVPGAGTLNGVFREDQIREAALDLDLITRGAVNPFAAMLERHEDTTEIPVMGGTPIPIEAVAGLVRLDISLVSDRHVVMEYAVRVRSNRSPNLVHDEGLNALVDELTVFAPADFVPPPPMDPAP